jgi:hypothetical protein
LSGLRACDAEGRSGIGAGMARQVHAVDESLSVGYIEFPGRRSSLMSTGHRYCGEHFEQEG